MEPVIARVPKQLFIGGSWRDATGGATFAVDDPSTGRVLAQVADATVEDGTAAMEAAVAAQAEWARSAPRDRGEILRRAFELITERTDDLARLMTLEMGKTLAESRAEIGYAAEFFRWFSEESVRIHGRYSVAPNGASRLLTLKQPVGPCLMITPWNFPLAMATRKIGPAIAAGCTMVLKPAGLTPFSALAAADILREAGLPEGVLNVITTSHTGAVMGPLIADPRLRKLTFTGSTEVGRTLIEQSAQNLLRVSMELGGNAPFIVFEDADLDAAVEGAMLAKMRNIGEACTAANRFLVQASVTDEFAGRLAAKVAELVDDAVGRGARVLTGGSPVDGEGWFYQPTVLTNVPKEARLCAEEIFGPVAAIVPFDDEAEAIREANATEYGLVAYAFTRDFARAARVFEALETGMVGINQGIVSNPAAPFGGVKASGFGREGGFEGIDEYLETKYVGFPWE
jgi:succinate-semialdehyde dehydrogenase/glutarate-semialdehyde dehydrogenase